MRTFAFWKFQAFALAGAKRWSYRLIAVGVSVVLLAVAAGVASERSHREVPSPATGIANAYSGSGNLVPVF
jgi:hypothetical protein